MRITTLLNRLLRLPGLWVQDVRLEETRLVLVCQRRFRKATCPVCRKPTRGRFSERTRRWRHLAIWTLAVEIEAPIRRTRCLRCRRVVTEQVPWARPGSHFTRPFEDAVVFLIQNTNQTATSQLCAISWVTVGTIARRLADELLDPNRMRNLRRIGVDEISYRKRHKYVTIVVDHDTGNVVWAHEGKSKDTFVKFFDGLPPNVLQQIEIVTMDLSAAYQSAVREKLPHAGIAFDKFHLAKLATEALNQVRREVARSLEEKDRKSLKKTRWSLARSPENRTEKDETRLDAVRRHHRPVYRAMELKDAFLSILQQSKWQQVADLINAWLAWAARSRLRPFVKFGRTIRKHLDGILLALENGVSNARSEGTNNKARLLSHRAYGFHSAESFIGMIYATCAGIRVQELHLV